VSHVALPENFTNGRTRRRLPDSLLPQLSRRSCCKLTIPFAQLASASLSLSLSLSLRLSFSLGERKVRASRERDSCHSAMHDPRGWRFIPYAARSIMWRAYELKSCSFRERAKLFYLLFHSQRSNRSVEFANNRRESHRDLADRSPWTIIHSQSRQSPPALGCAFRFDFSFSTQRPMNPRKGRYLAYKT